jgi:hypothetical protein
MLVVKNGKIEKGSFAHDFELKFYFCIKRAHEQSDRKWLASDY